MRLAVLPLAALMLTLPLACRKPPTPAPTPLGSTIVLKVFVLRDIDDATRLTAQKYGYIYGDNHIRSLVTDMIARSDILAGTPVNFSWPGQVVNEIVISFQDDLGIDFHPWVPYPGWVAMMSFQPGYQANAINIFFVPGIIDSSNPTGFMDSFALDPNGNNEASWWDQNVSGWRPMILISDCWVHSSVTESVLHAPGNPGTANRRVPTTYHFGHLVVHHALGRYLFRYEDTANWTHQEQYNTAGGPEIYMRWWDARAKEPGHQTEGIFVGEIFDRIDSGDWNNP